MRGCCFRSAVLFFTLIILCCGQVFSSITFGSRDSTIKVTSGARFNVGSSNLSISGTLSEDTGAFVTGNSFSFDNGLLEQDTTEAFAIGVYDPNSLNVLQLTGNGLFRFEPGTVVPGISVSGSGNEVSGQPLLLMPITLSNGAADLSIGIQNALSQNLVLNGGSVTLIDDLTLADNVMLVGPGYVDLNNRILNFGGYYSSVWASSLTLHNAASMVLNGDLQLSNVWTVDGICRLNGNGNILTLASTGQIVLNSGAKLYVEDTVIKGLSDIGGQIVFTDATSELHISNADLVLTGTFTTPTGQIFVEGPSTFVLRGWNWNITAPAKLTVDSNVLWLEVLARESAATSGELRVPRAIYDANGYNSKNVALNISDGVLVLSNDGIIKETITTVANNPNADITNGNVTNNIVMNQILFLNSNQVVNITNTAGVTMNGNGQTIVFNNTGGPQFIVQPGVNVTLENITFSNLNENTFDVKPGGQVTIGPNTTFEFSQDLTFSNGAFNILPSGAGTVFTLVSSTGSKVVNFSNPDDPTAIVLNLGDNTLKLQNIEVGSVSQIAYGPGNLIQLDSGSSIDIDVDTGLNFEAIGPDNALSLMMDNLTLSGLITFGEAAVNELAIRFILINGLDPSRVLAGEIHPQVNFSGGPGIMLGGSASDAARLVIENPYVVFDLQDPNAFLLDQNGQIFFKELDLRSNDIKQYSSGVLINGTRIVGHKIDPSYIRLFSGRENQAKTNVTKPATTEKVRTKKRIEPKPELEGDTVAKDVTKEKIENRIKNNAKQNDTVSKHNQKNDKNKNRTGNEKNNRQNPKHLRLEEGLEDVLGINVSDDVSEDFSTLRSVSVPLTYDNLYEDIELYMTVPVSGNILLMNSHLSNLITQRNGVSLPFNIVLKDGSTITLADEDVVLNSDVQKINVVGVGNVIEVPGTFKFNNNLLLDAGSELTFQFIQTGSEIPMVIFDQDCELSVEYKGVLRFQGTGIVKFSDGVVINLNGKKVVEKKTGEIITIERAQLIIHDGATLDFEENGESKIRGVGKISIQDRGYISPSVVNTFFIGDSVSDDIDIEVIGASKISLDLVNATEGQAKISCQYLTSAIRCENGGTISIGDNGIIEFNCYGSQLRRGYIKEFSFDGGGRLYVKENGILRMAPNRPDPATGYGYKLDWYGFETTVNKSIDISQNAFIEFVDYKLSGNFNGIINPSNSDLYYDYYNGTKINFDQLASMLVNRNSVLTVSIQYLDESGNSFVRTKDGISVPLKQGDVIDSDNSTTGNIYGHDAQNKPFVISANGTRK